MREIVLSSSGESFVYLVPDTVAENLREYCLDFCDRVYSIPKFSKKNGVCYNHADFIDYLNESVFPNEPSKEIKNLGFTDGKIPSKYADLPSFSF